MKHVIFAAVMSQPDALDHRIMKEIGSPQVFQWNVRESYSSIAKRVGVDEETVRKRIKRAEREGYIVGWRVVVNPSLVGCVDAYIDLEVGDPNRKETVLSQLRLLEGMDTFLNLEGGGLFISFYSESGQALERKSRLIGSICGTDKLTTWSGILPPCDLKSTETDWRIIWAIRDDPRKNLSQIAEEVGVSTRTVNRRLTLLTERKAFFLMGRPNFGQTPNITANFLIHTVAGKASLVAEKIASKFENITFGGPVSPQHLMYNIAFHNLVEAGKARDWVRGLQRVTKVRMGIVRDMIGTPDWIEGEIKKRMQSSRVEVPKSANASVSSGRMRPAEVSER